MYNELYLASSEFSSLCLITIITLHIEHTSGFLRPWLQVSFRQAHIRQPPNGAWTVAYIPANHQTSISLLVVLLIGTTRLYIQGRALYYP